MKRLRRIGAIDPRLLFLDTSGPLVKGASWTDRGLWNFGGFTAATSATAGRGLCEVIGVRVIRAPRSTRKGG